jgi:hypothetical protein
LVDFASFESAFEKSGGWAILIQKPTQIPAAVDRARWLKAADELAQAGQENEAAQAKKALAAH